MLAQRDEAGLPFIIVGGQAANIWATYYLPREPRLKGYLPFTSKDLDLIGTKADAARVAALTQWKEVTPPVLGGPIEAALSCGPEGQALAVEFLREIKGVPHDTILAYARENVVRVPGSEEPLPVRVLDPVLLMAGKIRNAVDIDQDLPGKPRQDAKHVGMLALCVPHFLEDVRTQITAPAEQKRTLTEYVTMLAALMNTYSGRLFEAQHPGVIGWSKLIPPTFHHLAFASDLQQPLRQLGARP